MQKHNAHRSKRLTSLAHDMPCMATFPHECNQAQGCHPAHANWQRWGKGIHMKAPDWAFAAMCGNAHREIDGKVNATMSREAREAEWMHAFVSTHDWLWTNKRIRVA
jgi:hypothetical protein